MFSKFSSGYKIIALNNSKGMTINSTTITNRLRELGCVENKTYIGFNLPILENSLYRHFIRGYFDGDGSISIRKDRSKQRLVSICSIDINFLEQLKNKLLEFNINSSIYKEKRKGKKLKLPSGKYTTNGIDMYRVLINSHKDRLKFYEFLYKDCSIKLERKYKLYNEYYVNTVLTLENKNSKVVQRIGDEPLINYDLLTNLTFYKGKEVDNKTILSLYDSGLCEFQIHKQTNIGRSKIHKIIKEYNSPKSARQPEKVENIC